MDGMDNYHKSIFSKIYSSLQRTTIPPKLPTQAIACQFRTVNFNDLISFLERSISVRRRTNSNNALLK